MNINSGIHYNDYLLTIVGLDAEWTRHYAYQEGGADHSVDNCFNQLIVSPFSGIADFCLDYRKDYLKVTEEREVWDSGSREGFLYRPLNYVPVGDVDALTITLVDDFEPAQALTSTTFRAVEENTIAFCPKMKTLISKVKEGLIDEVEKEDAWKYDAFVDLHEIWNGDALELPLSIVCRFKYSALPHLGGSLLFEKVFYHLLVTEIVKCFGVIIDESSIFAPLLGVPEAEIEARLRKGVKISFLDLQEQEEFALLFISDNAVIPTAILSRIQSLKFKEILGETESSLYGKAVTSSVWYKHLSEFKKNNGEPQSDLYSQLRDAHLFRWSRTTLSVRQEVFTNRIKDESLGSSKKFALAFESIKDVFGKSKVGWVTALSEMQFCPGHQAEVEDEISNVESDNVKFDDDELRANLKTRIHEYGNRDWLVPHWGKGRLGPLGSQCYIQFEDLLIENLKVIQASVKPATHRSIVGFRTSLAVVTPIPEGDFFVGNHDKDADHTSPFTSVISKMRDSYFREDGAFSTKTLYQKTEECLLPNTLRVSLRCLYQNIATILANPFAFDNVLDLYDAWGALYNYLSRDLPARQKKDSACDFIQYRPDSETISALTKVVDGLQSALQMRLYRAFPEDEHRDWAVDFRGGLNQIFQGVDIVMKSGIHLLRNDDWGVEEDRTAIGILMNISLEPGIHIYTPELDASKVTNLGVIQMDLPHSFHIPSYIEVLHETFHLIYKSKRRGGGNSDKKEILFPRLVVGTQLDLDLSEIFSNALLCRFIVPDSPRIISKYLAIRSLNNYGLSSTSVEGCKGHVMEAYYESLANIGALWYFSELLADVLSRCDDVSLLQDLLRGRLKDLSDGNEKSTLEYWNEIAPILYVPNDLIKENPLDLEKFKNHFLAVVKNYSSSLESYLPLLVIEVYKVYQKHKEDCEVKYNADKGALSFVELRRQLEQSVICPSRLCGQAMIGESYGQNGVHIDGLLLISVVLEREVRKWCALATDHEDGKIRFTNNVKALERDLGKCWVTPISNHLFTQNLEQRGCKLQGNISALKTFWGISSRSRGRRFGELIYNM